LSTLLHTHFHVLYDKAPFKNHLNAVGYILVEAQFNLRDLLVTRQRYDISDGHVCAEAIR
jgi:hypothetical protein